MQKLLGFALISVIFYGAWRPYKQTDWNPDAGLVSPISKAAEIMVSSNPEQGRLILDGNPETAWESLPPLPTNFMQRADQNVFLKAPHITGSMPAHAERQRLHDADLNTASEIFAASGAGAWLKIELIHPELLNRFYIKYNAIQAIEIQLLDADGNAVYGKQLAAKDNFQWLEFPANVTCNSVMLRSKANFQLFEIAANPCQICAH